MKPIELRLTRWAGKTPVYTVDRVYPGIGNVVKGLRTFPSAFEARQWARTHHPGVPLLRNV